VRALPAAACEAQLDLVAPSGPPGRVEPERVVAVGHAEVPLEVDLVGALEAQHGLGVEMEVARVDLEAIGKAVPRRRRRLREGRRGHGDETQCGGKCTHVDLAAGGPATLTERA